MCNITDGHRPFSIHILGLAVQIATCLVMFVCSYVTVSEKNWRLSQNWFSEILVWVYRATLLTFWSIIHKNPRMYGGTMSVWTLKIVELIRETRVERLKSIFHGNIRPYTCFITWRHYQQWPLNWRFVEYKQVIIHEING